jgi:hypothetical protein
MPKVLGAFMLPCGFSPAEDTREQKRQDNDPCDQSDEAIEPSDAGALGLGGVELLRKSKCSRRGWAVGLLLDCPEGLFDQPGRWQVERFGLAPRGAVRFVLGFLD